MKSLLAMLIICTTIGCGGYTSSVTAKESPGWMKLIGNLTDVTISVDNGQTWAPKKEIDRYELQPGTHEIRIFRSGQLVLQRVVIISEGVESEVKIP